MRISKAPFPTIKGNGRCDKQVLLSFKSPADFMAIVETQWREVKDKKLPSGDTARSVNGDPFFGKCKSLEDALEQSRTTHTELQRKLEALAKTMQPRDIAVATRKRVSSPVGGNVCVPAYLSGAPNPMRRRTRQASASVPLTVVVDVTSSSHVPTETIEKVGTATAAMLQAIATRRAVRVVSLNGFNAYDGDVTWFEMPFAAAPFDLGRLGFWLSNPVFTRAVMLSATHMLAASIWASGSARKAIPEYRDYRPRLSVNLSLPFPASNPAYSLQPDWRAAVTKHYRNDVLIMPPLSQANTSYSEALRDPKSWAIKTINDHKLLR